MRKIASLLSMLMLISALAFGQTRTVSGQVKNDQGEPIPFATVTETGTNNATRADANGLFSIKIKDGSSLTVTAAGHQARTIANPSGNNVQVALTIVAGEGQEVVVTTALGVKKRPKELGYANTTVRADQIINGRAPNLASALSGKVAGLTVQNTSNSVNAAPRITLRGNRSIFQTNTAIVVLDGVPVNANIINTINPNDIESVTTLKGGQAATLYGSDGVNGVLVINTKRGGGKPSVSFTSTANFEQVAYLPDFQDEFGSGSHYSTTREGNFRPFENQQYGDQYDGSIRSAGRVLEDGSYLELPYKSIPGVREDLFETGFSTQNDVAISGGDATSTYFLSFQDFNSEGIVWKDKYRRDVLRFSSDKTYGKFKASIGASYAIDRAQRTTSDFYFFAVNTGTWIPIGEMKDWKNYKFANPNAYFNDYYNNPWFELDNNRNDNRNNYFTGNLTLNLKPANWVNLTYRIGTNITNNNQKSWTNRFAFSNWAKKLAYTKEPQYNDYYGIFRTTNDIQGGVADFTQTTSRINADFMADFNKDWGNISAKFLVGNNLQAFYQKRLRVGSTSVIIPDLFNTSNRSGELVGGLDGDNNRAEDNSRTRKVGNYGQVSVGFKDFLFVNGSLRYDITSVFFSPTRPSELYSYAFYGGDVSFVVTDAFPSIKSDAFSFFKLRGSWNRNGNDNLGPYRLDPVFNTGPGFPYGSTVGTTVGNEIPAADLQPEFVNTTEVGFEAAFWKDKINIDFTAYKQNSNNQILPVQISSSTGATTTLLNAAKIDNKGIEAEVRARLVRTRNWVADIFGNYTLNTNEVKELFINLERAQLNSNGRVAFVNAQVGNPFPWLRGIGWMRTPEGKIVIDPADGWPVLDTVQHEFGRTIPKHSLGMGFRLTYKLLTLAANAEFRGGHVIYHDIGEDLGFTGSGKVTTTYHREQFVFPNSAYWDGSKYVDNANIPVSNDLSIYGAWGDYSFARGILGVAEVFATSANFWKLRDVSLSFEFPKAWMGSGRIIKGATFSIFGRNMVTLLPKENMYTDPEFANTNGNGVGISNSLNTPPTRQFGGTLNVIF